jgi:hypothetical protein
VKCGGKEKVIYKVAIIPCIISGESAERGVAIVVHTIIVRIVFKKMCVITESLPWGLRKTGIFIVQFSMSTSEYEDDEVEELYGIIEKILDEDGKSETNTIFMTDWKMWLEVNQIETFLDHMDQERETREVKYSLTLVQ